MCVVNFWTVSSVEESCDTSLAISVYFLRCGRYTDVISILSGRMSILDSD